MDNNNDFSGIPALNDVQGLENYLNAQSLQAQGLTPTPAPQQQNPAPQEAQPNPAQPAPAAQPAQPAAQPAAQPQQPQFTKEQIAQIIAQADALRAQQNAQQRQQPQQQSQAQPFQYTEQERNFVLNAMQRGYSLAQINSVIMQRRMQSGMIPQSNPALEQRMNQLENYLRTQEYRAAENAFIEKLSGFGDKFGLSEQDLVVFGNAALAKGINIAMPNVDLETVFKAVYPEQYAIRVQRMSNTNTSQIYGGTSIPEGNRALAGKAEDAYVEAFLKQTMPNQYGMLNKK